MDDRGIVRVLNLRKRNLERQRVARVKPWIHVLYPGETLDEEAGGAQQHQREPDFRDNKSTAQTIAPCALGRTSAAFLECFSEFWSRTGQTGSKTENDSRCDANRERDAKNEYIDVNFASWLHSMRAVMFTVFILT